jgi:hypothetical protein
VVPGGTEELLSALRRFVVVDTHQQIGSFRRLTHGDVGGNVRNLRIGYVVFRSQTGSLPRHSQTQEWVDAGEPQEGTAHEKRGA